jgi:hypothetical protein
MPVPAKVTVTRTHPDDVRQRQVLARIDDEPQVTLMFGESFTREIAPGTHRLRADNTLFRKKVEFTVRAGEHVEFALVNTAGRLTLGFLATMGVAPLFLRVERKTPQP